MKEKLKKNLDLVSRFVGAFIGRCLFVVNGFVNNGFMWCLGCLGLGYVVVLVMGRYF